jgi:hypothetical protein
VVLRSSVEVGECTEFALGEQQNESARLDHDVNKLMA